MSFTPKAFIDSDVFISSLISQKGAACFLIWQTKIPLFISNISAQEIKRVTEELRLDDANLRSTLKRFKITSINQSPVTIKRNYAGFVSDINDTHIVAGAKNAKARFLITYNLKHYKVDKLQENLKIVCLTPAQFLQYLRNQET